MNRSNLVLVLFIMSVGLNGVLIGLNARDWLGYGSDIPAQAHMLDQSGIVLRGQANRPADLTHGFAVHRFIRALPDTYKHRAHTHFKTKREQIQKRVRQAHEARFEAITFLTSPEFDPEQSQRLFEEARQARADLEAYTESIIVDFVAGLSPEDRSIALQAALGPNRSHGQRLHRPSPARERPAQHRLKPDPDN